MSVCIRDKATKRILLCADLSISEMQKIVDTDPARYKLEDHDYKKIGKKEKDTNILSLKIRRNNFLDYAKTNKIDSIKVQQICSEIFYKWNANYGDVFLHAFLDFDGDYKVFYSYPTMQTIRLLLCLKIEELGIDKVLKDLKASKNLMANFLRTTSTTNVKMINKVKEYIYSNKSKKR
mgnify:CR=1 FL=1